MKNLYLLFFLSLIALPIDAQISLNSVDFPTAGWVNALHKDTAVGTVNFGAKGANQTYDFSMFTPDKNDTVFYKAMTGTQQTNIPNGNLAATSNNIDFIFFNRNSSNYTIEGIEGDLLGLHSFRRHRCRGVPPAWATGSNPPPGHPRAGRLAGPPRRLRPACARSGPRLARARPHR